MGVPDAPGPRRRALLGIVTLFRDEGKRRRVLAWLALLFVYARCLEELKTSPWVAESVRRDVGMREKVAAYTAEHTRPDDRVFYFGIDPYTLYIAQRLPAAPYPMSFVVDLKPALRPPTTPRETGPDPAARARIAELQSVVATDACARLVEHPPRGPRPDLHSAQH
jgi:hypothetical protein